MPQVVMIMMRVWSAYNCLVNEALPVTGVTPTPICTTGSQKFLMNEKMKKDLVNQSEEGRKLFSALIKTGNINLWAPVKKRHLLRVRVKSQS